MSLKRSRASEGSDEAVNEQFREAFLRAQHKATLTNLYQYKRQINALTHRLKTCEIQRKRILNGLLWILRWFTNISQNLEYLVSDNPSLFVKHENSSVSLETYLSIRNGKDRLPYVDMVDSLLSLQSISLDVQLSDLVVQYEVLSGEKSTTNGPGDENKSFPSDRALAQSILGAKSMKHDANTAMDMDTQSVLPSLEECGVEYVLSDEIRNTLTTSAKFLQNILPVVTKLMLESAEGRQTSESEKAPASEEVSLLGRYKTLSSEYFLLSELHLAAKDEARQLKLQVDRYNEEARCAVRAMERVKYAFPEVEKAINAAYAGLGPIATAHLEELSKLHTPPLIATPSGPSSPIAPTADSKDTAPTPKDAATSAALSVESHGLMDKLQASENRVEELTNMLTALRKENEDLLNKMHTLEEETTLAKEDLDGVRVVSEVRMQQLTELAAEKSALQSQLAVLTINPAREEDVLSHPLYISLYNQASEANNVIHSLSEEVAALNAKLESQALALSSQTSRVDTLLAPKSADERELRARQQWDKELEKLRKELVSVVSQRDAAQKENAQLKKQIKSEEIFSETVEEQKRLIETLQSNCARLNADLSKRNVDISTGILKDAQPTSLEEAIATLSRVIAERDQYLSSLASVSLSYEAEINKTQASVALCASKDMAYAALQAKLAKYESSPNTSGDLAACEKLVQEAKELEAAATEAVASVESAMAEMRASLHSADDQIGKLAKELSAAQARIAILEGSAPSIFEVQNLGEANRKIYALSEKLSNLERQSVEIQERWKSMEAENLQLKEANALQSKKQQKKQEKIKALKESVESLRMDLLKERKRTFTSTLQTASGVVGDNAHSARGASDETDFLRVENMQLRKSVFCNICNERERNTVLIRCSHTFCRECVDTRVKVRNRKCPTCNNNFADTDIRPIYLS